MASAARDALDEDWFRNPRAGDCLRARASAPAYEALAPLASACGGAPLARAMEEALA